MGENESSTVKPIAPFKLYNKNKQEITDIDQLENEYNDFKIKKKHTILEKRAEGLEEEKESEIKKNTNKELKEGEKEKKTDILKLFGDTNLLASINKLDISIKKNFKTFIFNSMNDISEFFF